MSHAQDNSHLRCVIAMQQKITVPTLLADVVADALHAAIAQGCRVDICTGNADLDVMGRIGALLRY